MRTVRSVVSIATLVFAINWPLVLVGAGQVTVDDDGPADYRSIVEAVKAANEGDTVLVKAGRYQGGHLQLKNGMTLQGTGADVTIIDWRTLGPPTELPAMEIREKYGVTIDGFTFDGGGITIHDCAPVITNNSITNNSTIGLYMSFNGMYGIYGHLDPEPFTTPEEIPVINGNTITGNKIGIFITNPIGLEWGKHPSSLWMLDFRSNWWGTTNAVEVLQHIDISPREVTTVASILYEPWLTASAQVLETKPGIHFNNIHGNRETNIFGEFWDPAGLEWPYRILGTLMEGSSWGSVKDTMKRRVR